MLSHNKYIGGDFSLTSLIPFIKKGEPSSDFYFPEQLGERVRSYFECGTDAISFYINNYWIRQESQKLIIWLPIHFCRHTIDRIGRILMFQNVFFSFEFYHDNSFFKRKIFAEGDVVVWVHFNKFYSIDSDIVQSLKLAKAYLIEDYVLAPFDICKITGDAAFNSLRKISPLSIAVGYSNDKMGSSNHDSAFNDCRKIASFKKSTFELNNNPILEKSFLQGFEDAERILEKRTGINSSSLSDEILFELTDWQRILSIRKMNYQCFKRSLQLEEKNILPGEFQFFMIKIFNRDIIQKKFFESNIYPPVHWVDAQTKLSSIVLSLPIDQRYDAGDMERLANVANELLFLYGDKNI